MSPDRSNSVKAPKEIQSTEPSQWPGLILFSTTTRLLGEDALVPLCWHLPVTTVKYIKTRSTGTVHISTKACLNSVAIWIWIRIQIPDQDRHQNLIICSLARCQPSWKFYTYPFRSFCTKLLADKQTDKHDKNITSFVEVMKFQNSWKEIKTWKASRMKQI